MCTFLTLLEIILLFYLVFDIYMIIRNDWVYEQRKKLIDEGKDKNYLSYDEMLNKFWWVWDAEKLRRR